MRNAICYHNIVNLLVFEVQPTLILHWHERRFPVSSRHQLRLQVKAIYWSIAAAIVVALLANGLGWHSSNFWFCQPKSGTAESATSGWWVQTLIRHLDRVTVCPIATSTSGAWTVTLSTTLTVFHSASICRTVVLRFNSSKLGRESSNWIQPLTRLYGWKK